MSREPLKFDISAKELGDLVEKRKLLETCGSVATISNRLHSSHTHGLPNDKEVLKQHGAFFGENFITPKMPHGFFFYFFKASQDPILIFLMVAAAITFIAEIIKNPKSGGLEGIAILVAVLIIVLVTSGNDYRKERQFKRLQKSIKMGNSCVVMRGGQVMEVMTKDLVVGDVYLPKYGDQIPADCILIEANDLKIDESSLTGESDLIKKDPVAKPYLLSGTHVMEGSGRSMVVAVGPNSQSGRIVALLSAGGDGAKPKSKAKRRAVANREECENEEVGIVQDNETCEVGDARPDDRKSRSILQEKLTRLSLFIGKIGICSAVVVFVVLLIRFCVKTYTGPYRKSFEASQLLSVLDFLIVAFTIVVVAVPEGLPLAVTLSLLYSVTRMLKENNLVRQLYSCETMGNATTICSDKTGTLTTNRMTVVQCYVAERLWDKINSDLVIPDSVLEPMCMNICLNKSSASMVEPPSFPGGLPIQLGNKTDCALIGFLEVAKTHMKEWQDRYPAADILKVFPFNSVKKMMTTLVRISDGKMRVLVKGASEVVLSHCKFHLGEGGRLAELSDALRRDINKKIVMMASDSLRTILLAFMDTELPPNVDKLQEADLAKGLTLVSIMGIEDPVRPEVPAAIKVCKKAGVTVRMVTGDNIITARSIALKCGILEDSDKRSLVLDSQRFNRLIRNEKGQVEQKLIDRVWPRLRVLARSSPQDKYTLVNGIINSRITKNEEVVAVTGDGTNDAPALKCADVGFSMGISGTDVAKEASDIVLTDDNFASIIRALLWGRNVYDSISKFIQFQLTVNIVAIVTSVVTSVVYGDNVLKPMQLLWVNLLMDSMASLALATDPPTMDLLNRPPYGRKRNLLSSNMIHFIIYHSLFQITTLLLLIFLAPSLLDIDNGFLLEDYLASINAPSVGTQHMTMIFNTFVFMQFFNQINARRVHSERNVLQNIHKNKIFLGVIVVTLVIQVIIVQFTYTVFHVIPLTIEQWLWCLFIGSCELLYHQVIITIPRIKIPKKYRDIGSTPNEEIIDSDVVTSPRMIWLRGLRRLQQQIRVIEAFKAAVENPGSSRRGGEEAPFGESAEILQVPGHNRMSVISDSELEVVANNMRVSGESVADEEALGNT